MLYRSIKLSDPVGAIIPVEGSDKLLAAVGRKLCLVDRQTGITVLKLTFLHHHNVPHLHACISAS